MLRIPVYMHNVPEERVFRPSAWNAFGTADPEGPTSAPAPTTARSTALILSVVFGKSARRNATKDSAYECGMVAIGEGAPRFSVKFYLVAMLFVIFDIEVVFMYPWAVQFRDLVEKSPVALVSMAGFAGILAVAYVYAFRQGALSWKEKRRA
jgi:NADH-quinone oxidoreductase subunit A